VGRPYRFINFPVTECWSLISAAARWDSRSDFQYDPFALNRSNIEESNRKRRGVREPTRSTRRRLAWVRGWQTQTEV
jgi:hypothetical protein